ncbi:MAG: radical SAM protein [Candidatus Aminicenantaceae bacterium]
MELSSFTLILTDKCNFNCPYCYQKKGEKILDFSIIEKSLDFFLPYLKEECYVNFTGGEPLLALENLKKTVSYIQNKNKGQRKHIQYSLTTNGSLIDDEVLNFLKQHRFSLMVSFDGLVQDVFRKKGSLERIVSVIKNLLVHPDIDLVINSVFMPESIGYLSKSFKFITKLGASDIRLSLSINSSWNDSSLLRLKKELHSLKDFILFFYKRTRTIPLSCFRRNIRKGIFSCFAGFDRMTLNPEGKLWGCYLFSNYFNGKKGTPEYLKYCFGDLDEFIDNHKMIYLDILRNYSNLRMDNFYTNDRACKQCPELEGCAVCPVSAAFSSSNIGKIPDWKCKYRKIVRKERDLFLKDLKNI